MTSHPPTAHSTPESYRRVCPTCGVGIGKDCLNALGLPMKVEVHVSRRISNKKPSYIERVLHYGRR